MGQTLQDHILSAGLINETQLELAVCEQKRRGVSFNRILVDLGLVAPEKLADFVAQQARTKRVDLVRQPPNREVSMLIPLDTARRLRALPIDRLDGTLIVAMADPFDIVAIDALGQLSGFFIDVVTATERDILNTIDQLRVEGPSIQESIARVIEDKAQDQTPDQLQSALSADLVEADPDDAPIIQLVGQVITRAIHRRAEIELLEPPSLAELKRALPQVRFEQDNPLQLRARFSKRELPAAELLARVVGLTKVADIALPEPSIEEVIRRIYEKAGKSAMVAAKAAAR